MRSTWALISKAAPTNESDTATETINATVMVKLRRSPLPTSLLTNENLMPTAPYAHTYRALDRG